jgi:hypothetical protein
MRVESAPNEGQTGQEADETQGQTHPPTEALQLNRTTRTALRLEAGDGIARGRAIDVWQGKASAMASLWFLKCFIYKTRAR